MATVLLTGGSGVVGSELLDKLRGHEVIALAHRMAVRGAGRTIKCDLAAPSAGLAKPVWDSLAGEIDLIVHSAAATDFGMKTERIERLNIGGTAQMLELAEQAGVPLLHVSTAATAWEESARRSEQDYALSASANALPYIVSKRKANRLIQDSGHPTIVLRPSLVLGHSETGAISRMQGVHSVCRALIRGKLPFLPVAPEAHFDIIASDIVASAIVGAADSALRNPADAFGEYWLTAGPNALRGAELVDLLTKVMAEYNSAWEPPEFLPSQLRHGTPHEADDFAALSRTVAGAEPLPCSLGEIPGGPPPVSKEATLRTAELTIRFLADRVFRGSRLNAAS